MGSGKWSGQWQVEWAAVSGVGSGEWNGQWSEQWRVDTGLMLLIILVGFPGTWLLVSLRLHNSFLLWSRNSNYHQWIHSEVPGELTGSASTMKEHQ